MFSSGPKYQKLVTNLRLAINRLKLIEKKKSELAIKARREIADYILAGKEERARIRVEHIIREDYLVEAMELVEMYCDLILARMGLIQSTKDLDEGLEEPVSSVIWATPRLQSEVAELVVVSDQLGLKYGKSFAQNCRGNVNNTVNEKLLHKLSVEAPPRHLVERYMIEIAKSFNVAYHSPTADCLSGDATNLLAGDDASSRGNGGGIEYDATAPASYLSRGQPFKYSTPASAPSLPLNRLSTSSGSGGPMSPTQFNQELPELPAVPTSSLSTIGSSGLPNDDVNFDDLAKRFEDLKKRK